MGYRLNLSTLQLSIPFDCESNRFGIIGGWGHLKRVHKAFPQRLGEQRSLLWWQAKRLSCYLLDTHWP